MSDVSQKAGMQAGHDARPLEATKEQHKADAAVAKRWRQEGTPAAPAGVWASWSEHPLVVSGLAMLAATILALWQ